MSSALFQNEPVNRTKNEKIPILAHCRPGNVRLP